MMKKLLLTLGVIALPSVAFAATLIDVFNTVKSILDIIIPIALTVAVIYFFWGVGKYMTATGDSEKQEEARGIMIYGIIGLFVMVSVWGLVRVVGDTFGVTSGGTQQIPGVPRVTQ
ncbi:MAG: hypothetical protein HZC04_01460 [Candidatus Lloydbacteria bacterium]|nr:hypothetical protein [Candidatus Lloydbacteria bacterium]